MLYTDTGVQVFLKCFSIFASMTIPLEMETN